MQKETKQKLYVSPEVEVIAIKANQVICQSNTERLGDETPGWNWE